MLKNIMLAGIAAFICLAVLEGAIRLVGIGYPTFYEPHSELGFALRPGARGWYRKEGEAFVEINREGRRDDITATEKPEEVYRVAVLGDSFALGLETSADAIFPAVMSTKLQACAALAGKTVEVLNFGAAGYGTAQQLLTYRLRASSVTPDAVVLAFFSGNDVRNNSRVLQNDPMRPYFTLHDGELVLDDEFIDSDAYKFRTTFPASAFYDLVNHIRLLQVVNEARGAIRYYFQYKAPEGEDAHGEGVVEAGLDLAALAPPQSDEWRAAWSVTDALIRQLALDVRSDGAVFIAASVSNAIQVHPDGARRSAAASVIGVEDLSYADRRLEDIGRKEGFPVVVLADAMQAKADAEGVYFHGFENTNLGQGHYNAAGHAVAGAALSEALCHRLSAGAGLAEAGTQG